MDVTQVRANPPRNMPVNGAAITTSAPATGNPIPKNALNATFQVTSGASCTVVIEVTNDPTTASGATTNWLTLGTMTTTGAGTDGFSSSAAWNWVRARVTAASTPTVVWMGS